MKIKGVDEHMCLVDTKVLHPCLTFSSKTDSALFSQSQSVPTSRSAIDLVVICDWDSSLNHIVF